MLQIEFGSIEKQLLSFCQKWLDELSDGRVIGIDALNCYGIKWGNEQVFEVLQDYLGSNIQPKVQHVDISQCHPNFYKRDDGGYNLEFDIPLNGEISDLTAEFEFNRKNSKFEVVLHDIHVM
ncbi:DUF7668 domain-containing protein [Marinobacter sp. 1Y8]